MKITSQIIIVTAGLALGSLAQSSGGNETSEISPERLAMLEAAAARTGALSVSYIRTTWDDIPLVPFPKNFTEKADPFPIVEFTLDYATDSI
jgi:hypothetical protein